NTLTGEGLAEVLKGAQVVVDVANSPSFEDKPALDFFETSGRNLLSAEKSAGVKHHVALSVVGTDRLTGSGPGSLSGYFRAKMAQEKLIQTSAIPYTIARATQFFEFVGRIADEATSGQTVHLPSVLFQPIFSDDLAANVAKIAVAKPLNGTIEIAGPDAIPFDEVARQYLAAHHDPRTVVRDEQARYFGTTLEERSLIPGENALLGSCHFTDWLSRTAPQH
ncbi:MAG TPA: NAD(P)H-binding protein, partial [Lacipirellulaceae bacterium]|nr:NAD(P)H-binding protein [Lacipirellulaceae bacterium]